MKVIVLCYSGTNSCQKILDDALVDMVAKDYQPVSLVEDEGFKNFVTLLDLKYVIPSRRKLTALVEAKYDEERAKAIQEVSRATRVSLTTDLWTSLSCESYMAVTAHYIDPSTWILKSDSLTSRFPETHTSLHISNALSDVIKSWGVEMKVTSIAMDNASNMVAAIPLISCLAHTLNIIVKRALGKMRKFIKSEKRVEKLSHTSSPAAVVTTEKVD
jgi:galactitol-specific phosphotransferase system IIB component